MTNYTPTDALPVVQIYDESDLVKGGIAGNSNLPIESLGDQAFWLQNRLGGYRDVVDVTGSISVSYATHANRLLSVTATANVTLTLDAVSGFKKGNKIAVVANLSGGGGPFWVNIVAADNIYNGSVIRTNIWLYDGEMVELVAGASTWLWTIAKGNFDKLAEHDLKRFAPKNSLVADGTLGDLRAKYPRLWEVVNATSISDATWSAGGDRYKGQFSQGNGTTTFRRPDYRAMFFRALDLGRGISLARYDAVEAGYEKDGIVDHHHSVDPNPNSNDSAGFGKMATGASSPEGTLPIIQSTGPKDSLGTLIGTTETRSKNIGFSPYIYY